MWLQKMRWRSAAGTSIALSHRIWIVRMFNQFYLQVISICSRISGYLVFIFGWWYHIDIPFDRMGLNLSAPAGWSLFCVSLAGDWRSTDSRSQSADGRWGGEDGYHHVQRMTFPIFPINEHTSLCLLAVLAGKITKDIGSWRESGHHGIENTHFGGWTLQDQWDNVRLPGSCWFPGGASRESKPQPSWDGHRGHLGLQALHHETNFETRRLPRVESSWCFLFSCAVQQCNQRQDHKQFNEYPYINHTVQAKYHRIKLLKCWERYWFPCCQVVERAQIAPNDGSDGPQQVEQMDTREACTGVFS